MSPLLCRLNRLQQKLLLCIIFFNGSKDYMVALY